MSEAKTSQLKPRQSTIIDPGPADSAHKIILPQNTTANLAQIPNEEASIAYDTDQQALVVNDGTGFSPISGGGGTPAGANTQVQFNDSGAFGADPGFTFSGGALAVTGGASQNSFRSFSSASVNELFFGRSTLAGESFVITHWPDAGPYTDLHMFGLSSNHLVLDANGRVGIGTNAPAETLDVAGTTKASNLKLGTGPLTVSGTGSEASGGGSGGSITASGPGAKAFGYSDSGSSITSSSEGTLAFGHGDGGGAILANTDGAMAFGRVNASSSIDSQGFGALAHGRSLNVGGQISATGVGASAWGYADSVIVSASGNASAAHGTGNVTASGTASHAHGGDGSTIVASGIAAHAHGLGRINAIGTASHAHGHEQSNGAAGIDANGIAAEAAGFIATGANNSIEANGTGSKAFGSLPNQGGNHIIANGDGSIAHGSNGCFNGNIVANGGGAIAGGAMDGGFPGNIAANGSGSIAHGHTTGSGAINATNDGSLALGYAQEALVINSQGIGSIASGWAEGFSVSANGNASIAVGKTTVEQHYAIADGAATFGDSNRVSGTVASAFGIGHSNDSYAAMLIGRYGSLAETPGSWVDTDTAFAIGNGTGIGAESLAFSISKAGVLNLPDYAKLRFTKDDNQVIPSVLSTFQVVELDDSDYDNTATAFVDGVFTVPADQDGFYQMCLNLTMESTGTGPWFATIRVNGTEVCRGGRNNVIGVVTTGSALSTILQLSAADVVDFGVFNETGADIQTEAFGPSNTVSISRLP